MSDPGESQYRPHRRARRLIGPAFGAACFLATFTGVVVLAVLLGSVVAAVVDRPDEDEEVTESFAARLGEVPGQLRGLITRSQSIEAERAGFKIGVAGSLWLLGLVALIAVPVGVGAAVYLEEYARPGRLRQLVQLNLSNLAGVPSIVYGLLGLALFVRAFGFEPLAIGPHLWAGGLTLSLLVLPVIVIATRESLRAVPGSLRQAALALGASRWQVIRDHVLPAALPGILTGTILALSRAIGETAPLLMVGAAGSILKLPKGPSDRYTALPVEIYNYAKQPEVEFRSVAAGGILVLLAILLTMNAAAIVLRNRTGRHSRG